MRNFLKGVLLCGVLLAGLGFYLFQWWSTARLLQEPVIYDVAKGTSLQILSRDLEQANVIDHALFFRIIVKVKDDFMIKTGHYKFVGAISPKEVYRILKEGEEFKEVVLSVTIPEGFSLDKILKRLAAQGLGTYEELAAITSEPQWLSSYGISSSTLEGFLYPETYVYHNRKPSGRQIIEDMIKSFFAHLPEGYVDQVKAKKLTLEQAVVFASLIELETKHDDERSKVSEVIWNRLRDQVPLGIDAALIYGIKGYDGDIRTRDLKDASNPYNTRIHKGLPPTAIGSPSRPSLEAVLNPTSDNYYYYVLVGDGKERHHFSKTLSEHNFYVDKLLKEMK